MIKTTFRVDAERWELFNKECKASFLRRDAYLSHVLTGETKIIEQLPQNCEEAHQWLKNRWFGQYGRLRKDVTEFVSVMLDKPLVDRLNQACNDRRIPRDAFIHCMLMFLTERLYEAALVIKDPRTARDAFWQVAEVCHVAQDEEDDEQDDDDIRDNMKLELLTIGLTTRQRNLEPLRPDYYLRELSFPPEKLARAKSDEALAANLLAELSESSMPMETNK